MNQEKQYDFIIVGSGIGGLSSAVVLAKNGFSVLVLEKNNQIGGALQVFSRDKCIFDTGVHYIGGLDKGENLYRMFKYLGIYDSLKLRSLDRDCFDLIRMPDGKSYPHGQGYESFTSQLIHLFPEEENAIYSFCEKLKEICDFFPLYNLELGDEQAYYNNPEILSLGAWDYVNSITNNQTLRSILLGSGPLYAGDQQSTPLYVVALIMNSYIKGSYRLVDGGSQIAKLLVRELRKYDGEILKRKEVISANYGDDKNITSVVCADGTEYRAKNFISNMHPSLTIDVFGKEKFRPAYRDRVQKLENTASSLMVYFSLKEKSFPYYNYNIYEHFSHDCWNSINDNSENWPHTLYVCTPASSKSEEFAESICVMCYMNLKDVKEWENTFNTTIDPSERNAAYLQFKKDKEEQIIKRLETRYPDFRSCIKNVYSSTPLTYRDYIGTPEGSLYGIKKDFNNPIGTTINSKTRIPNLYLTGQNIIFHGILGATIGSFVTCFNFVNHIEIIKKINEYMKNDFDIIVIGAGPAGTIASSKLMKEGFTVKIIEKMEFPRFVIGESLLPHSMDYLDELDLLKCVEDQKFQLKTGACFYHNEQRCDFLFKDQFTKGWDYTFQVKRADLDNALAKETAKKGADVEFNAEVLLVENGPSQQKVKYLNAQKEEINLTSRFVVDASGYGRVLPRMFDLEVKVSTPPRGAIFSHFDDSKRTEEDGRNIFIHAFNNNTCWIWSIPFSDGTASVGIVGDSSIITKYSENDGEGFKKMVGEFPGLSGRYANVEYKFEPRVILNYAVSVKQLYGEGYILCGNSTEFLDPIFSSGVTLAISSGYKAATIVSEHLKGKDVNFEDYSIELKKGIDVFRSYVNGWYDGTLQTIFFSDKTNEEMKRQICSVLAGYVWDETNPFVKKHGKVLNTLAKIIEM